MSEREEQFLKQNMFSLLKEVFSKCIGTIKMPIGTDNCDVETYKSKLQIHFITNFSLSEVIFVKKTLQICTVFNCVTLSTVISLYDLHLLPYTVQCRSYSKKP